MIARTRVGRAESSEQAAANARPAAAGIVLPAIPATTATSAGIAAKIILHSWTLAWAMSATAGVFALLGVLLVSTEAQATIRMWICHRAEHRLSAAEAFEIRRKIIVATGGRHWATARSTAARQAAVSYERPRVDLQEIMRITRFEESTPGMTEREPDEPLSLPRPAA